MPPMVLSSCHSLTSLLFQLLSDLQQLSTESLGLSERHSPLLLVNISTMVGFSRNAEELERSVDSHRTGDHRK